MATYFEFGEAKAVDSQFSYCPAKAFEDLVGGDEFGAVGGSVVECVDGYRELPPLVQLLSCRFEPR